MLFKLYSPAIFKMLLYALSNKTASLSSLYLGPTAWIMYFAFKLNPVVITALPVSHPPNLSHAAWSSNLPAAVNYSPIE